MQLFVLKTHGSGHQVVGAVQVWDRQAWMHARYDEIDKVEADYRQWVAEGGKGVNPRLTAVVAIAEITEREYQEKKDYKRTVA